MAAQPTLDKPVGRNAGPPPEPAPPNNVGKMTPGPAFLMRLSEGFDEATQYQSAYTMEVPWNGSGFARDNIHYGPDGATLVIQKRRMLSRAYAGAELQRKGFYGYGRYEAIVKAPVGSGLVSSFFTHTSEQFGDPHDEIDIEFLGRNTHALHINYFKDGVPAGSFYAPTDFDTSSDFHLYAFEWAPDSIRWFADGKLVHEVHGPEAHVPRAAGRVMMNIWSAGPASRNWLGPRGFKNNASVVYRCVSHVPLGQTGAQCSDDYKPPVASRG
jgi:beta-glucanase (GH16 family)